MKVRVCNFSDVFKTNREEEQRLFQLYFFQYVKAGKVQNEYFTDEAESHEVGEIVDIRKNHMSGKWFVNKEKETK